MKPDGDGGGPALQAAVLEAGGAAALAEKDKVTDLKRRKEEVRISRRSVRRSSSD